jgi:uncharacterized membrane protein
MTKVENCMSITKLGGHGSLLAKLVQPAQEVVDDENQLE